MVKREYIKNLIDFHIERNKPWGRIKEGEPTNNLAMWISGRDYLVMKSDNLGRIDITADRWHWNQRAANEKVAWV